MTKSKAPKKWYLFNTPGSKSGVKCDTEGCDYYKDVVPEEMELYLAIVCPKCGAPLLTIPDWNSLVILNKIVGFPLVRLLNWIGRKLNMKQMKLHATWDGKGNMELEEVNDNVYTDICTDVNTN